MTKIKPSNFPQKLLLASPRGFCAGVKRAIEILSQVCERAQGKTVYCYHQIVHNFYVVSQFEKQGVTFVNSLDEVPDGSILILSSHGVTPTLKTVAIQKHLQIIDATCPFVHKTHLEVKKYAAEGYRIIYIGQKNHDEVIGTIGEAPDQVLVIQTLDEARDLAFSSEEKLALVTQTTLSFDETKKIKQELKKKFPQLVESPKEDICQATQSRQNGVKELIKLGAQAIIVLGSPNSSNSNKLKIVAEKTGTPAYLLDQITDLNPQVLQNLNCVGLTAGASLPEEKVTEALNWFTERGVKIEEAGVVEKNLNFPLPEIIL